MFEQPLQRFRLGTVGATAVAVALFLSGCASKASSGGNDKAGGSADPVVLSLANTSFGLERHPAMQYFVDRVTELSGGALRIDVAQLWGDNAADAEQQVVRDVAAGTIELGAVGTQVFDTVGVTEFQALTAPMLIDNYPLQQAVLDSDIPAEMLSVLDKIGLAGIAVLGDGLRKPIAVTHPLLGPADYAGITFEAFRSQNHAEAIRALGATPIDTLPGSALLSGEIDGFEKGLRIYGINEMTYAAPYVTANVNLWPHTIALIANPQAISKLTKNQTEWLTVAAADASHGSTGLTDDDDELIIELCQSDARFADASEIDLQAMREAFTPIYTALNGDLTTRGFIDRINQLKRDTDPGPALHIPSDCTGLAAATPTDGTVPVEPSSSALDGTYRWTITRDDALAHGTPRDKTTASLSLFPTIFTVRMNDGAWTLRDRDGAGDHDEGGGTYTVTGDQVAFNWDGGLLTFTFTVDDDGTVHLDPQDPMNLGDQFIWATNAWEKIADAG